MRLTCPNCGAQYEVPDEVIPVDGRDVQCSNCGDTWFQEHPDHPIASQATPGTEPESGPEFRPESGPESELEYEPEPEAVVSDQDLHAAHEGSDPPPAEDPDYVEPDDAPPPPSAPPRPRLDGSVRDVLRAEAEREAELRAAESGGLESQPELGLDAADDTARRAKEARARMARLRGDPAPHQPSDSTFASIPDPARDDPDAADSRRGLLPDIEEINSTLKSDNAVVPHSASGPRADAAAGRRRSGFSRGFAISLLVATLLLLIYANAPRIAQTVPQIDPALNAYVGMVDSARLWLDTQIGRLAGR